MTSVLADILQLPGSAPEVPGVLPLEPSAGDSCFAAALQALLGSAPKPTVADPLLPEESALLTGEFQSALDSEAQSILTVPANEGALQTEVTVVFPKPGVLPGTLAGQFALTSPLPASAVTVAGEEAQTDAGESTPARILQSITTGNSTVALEVAEATVSQYGQPALNAGDAPERTSAPNPNAQTTGPAPTMEISSALPGEDQLPVSQRATNPARPGSIEDASTMPEKPITLRQQPPTPDQPDHAPSRTRQFAGGVPTPETDASSAKLTKPATASQRASETALRDAVTPFTRESIAVSVVSRSRSAASEMPSGPVGDSPGPAMPVRAGVRDVSPSPTSAAFARSFFHDTQAKRQSPVDVTQAPTTEHEIPIVTAKYIATQNSAPVAPVTTQTERPQSDKRDATPISNKSPLQSTASPVAELTPEPAPLKSGIEFTQAKVENTGAAVEQGVAGIESASPRTRGDSAIQDPPAPAVRYEIERPREFRVPGQIRVRITPPELGRVRIDLSSSRHGVIGTLRFDSERAREIVGRDVANLHRTLADAGIRVERLDIVGAATSEARTAFHQSTPDQHHGSSSFSRGSSQGQSQGGRYAQQHRYTPQPEPAPASWGAESGAAVWQAAPGMMMQVNLVA